MMHLFVDILDLIDKYIGKYTNIIDALIIVSIIVAIITLRKDHKRSRRENSVNLIIKWSESLNAQTSLAKKYVEKMNRQQIEHLFNNEEIEFNSSVKDEKELYFKIKALLSKDNANKKTKVNMYTSIRVNKKLKRQIETKHKVLKLTTRESTELRWLVINYLNMLESILTAWQHSSADDKIIEDEFEYMFDLPAGKDILKQLRMVAGSEKAYPAIEIFYNHLEEKRKQKLKRSGKL